MFDVFFACVRRKLLDAGIMERGQWRVSERPTHSPTSPIIPVCFLFRFFDVFASVVYFMSHQPSSVAG